MKPAANGECSESMASGAQESDRRPGKDVEGLLVVGRRSDDLPGGVVDVAVEPLLVDDLRRGAEVACAGPSEGACKTAVQDQQKVAAGQAFDPPAQVGHRQEALPIIGARVLRHQVARRPVVTVQRDAVTGEVDQQAVVSLDLDRQVLAQEGTELCEGDVLGQKLDA